MCRAIDVAYLIDEVAEIRGSAIPGLGPSRYNRPPARRARPAPARASIAIAATAHRDPQRGWGHDAIGPERQASAP
jgi:hypothetical protein